MFNESTSLQYVYRMLHPSNIPCIMITFNDVQRIGLCTVHIGTYMLHTVKCRDCAAIGSIFSPYKSTYITVAAGWMTAPLEWSAVPACRWEIRLPNCSVRSLDIK